MSLTSLGLVIVQDICLVERLLARGFELRYGAWSTTTVSPRYRQRLRKKTAGTTTGYMLYMYDCCHLYGNAQGILEKEVALPCFSRIEDWKSADRHGLLRSELVLELKLVIKNKGRK